MFDREEQGLLDTNPFSKNYGTNVVEIHPQPPNHLAVDAMAKNISFSFGKILKFVYIITSIVFVSGFILLIPLQEYQSDFFIAMIISAVISALFSFYGEVKYGKIKGKIWDIKEYNNVSKNEINTLRDTKNMLKNEITDLEVEKTQLSETLNELHQSQSQYAELITELKKLCKSKEEIMDIVDYMNETLERLLYLIHLNHRAYLLHNFYEVLKFRKEISIVHNKPIMNEHIYKIFLLRIIKQWRHKFEELGSNLRDIWEHEEISVEQFLWKVDEIGRGIACDLIVLEFEKCYAMYHPMGRKYVSKTSLLNRQSAARSESMPTETAINIPFVDFIDDKNHNKIAKFLQQTRSLKRIKSVQLSQDDIDADVLRKELNIQKKSHGMFDNVGFLISTSKDDDDV